MQYTTLKSSHYRTRYPYPQCVLTPVFILLMIIVIELPSEGMPQLISSANAVLHKYTGVSVIDVKPNRNAIPNTALDEDISDSELEVLAETPIKRSTRRAVQSSNLWDHIRAGFDLNGYEHPRVDQQLNWYAKHKRYINRVAQRGEPYLFHIFDEVRKRGMPTEIALLPVVESAFQPFAFSAGRASGIWQFIPTTGKRYGLKQNWWYDGRRDIHASTIAALDFLEDLHKQFKGDWLLALAAYNSGGGTVSKAIKKNRELNKPSDFWSLDLPKETRDYVPKLLAISALVSEPEYYKIKLKPLPNIPYFKRVDIKGQIDLARAAEFADISVDTLYRLNPGFNRWATAPNGPHYLLIPYENTELFVSNIEKYPPNERMQWKRHQVTANESLSEIAKKFNTSKSMLAKINKLGEGKKLNKGDSLVIPVASEGFLKYLADNKKAEPAADAKKVTHTISSGDTLFKLSLKYNIKMEKLAEWNNIELNEILVKGKQLVIKDGVDVDAMHMEAMMPSKIVAPPSKSTTRRVKYRVRDGDSLNIISQKFRVSVKQLIRWNNLTAEKAISPGQLLTLFVDVTRHSGNI